MKTVVNSILESCLGLLTDSGDPKTHEGYIRKIEAADLARKASRCSEAARKGWETRRSRAETAAEQERMQMVVERERRQLAEAERQRQEAEAEARRMAEECRRLEEAVSRLESEAATLKRRDDIRYRLDNCKELAGFDKIRSELLARALAPDFEQLYWRTCNSVKDIKWTLYSCDNIKTSPAEIRGLDASSELVKGVAEIRSSFSRITLDDLDDIKRRSIKLYKGYEDLKKEWEDFENKAMKKKMAVRNLTLIAIIALAGGLLIWLIASSYMSEFLKWESALFTAGAAFYAMGVLFPFGD